MSISGLFTRTLAMMLRNAALWVVPFSMLLVEILFSYLVGEITVFTAILTTLVSLAVTAIITGALVRMVDEMAEGRNPSIVEGFSAGGRNVFPLMLVRTILQAPVWIVAIIVTGSLVDAFGPLGKPEALSGGTLMASLSSISLAVVVILLVSLFTSTIAVGAERAVVLENSPVLAAVVRGWNLLWGKFTSYLKIGMGVVVVSLALGVLLACPLSLVIGAAAFSAAAGDSVNAAGPGSYGGMMFMVTMISVLLSTLTQILFAGAWTLAFRHWQGKDGAVLTSPGT